MLIVEEKTFYFLTWITHTLHDTELIDRWLNFNLHLEVNKYMYMVSEHPNT